MKEINSQDTLLHYENNWETSMGAWFPGERAVFRGKDIFSDLCDFRWMKLLLYGITGKIFNDKQIRLFEGLWVIGSSYPDPRIWNNRIAALCGTARSTVALAIGSATAVTEAQVYGGVPIIKSISLIKRAKQAMDKGIALDEFVRNEVRKTKIFPGYGRVIINKDERIKPTMDLLKELGLSGGEHVQIAFEIEKIFLTMRKPKKMNGAALYAAIAADQGFTEDEYSRYYSLGFSIGFMACYIDSVQKPEQSFFPLRCTSIQYHGPTNKKW